MYDARMSPWDATRPRRANGGHRARLRGHQTWPTRPALVWRLLRPCGSVRAGCGSRPARAPSDCRADLLQVPGQYVARSLCLTPGGSAHTDAAPRPLWDTSPPPVATPASAPNRPTPGPDPGGVWFGSGWPSGMAGRPEWVRMAADREPAPGEGWSRLGEPW